MAVWYMDGFDYTTGDYTPGATFYNADIGISAGTSRWSTNCFQYSTGTRATTFVYGPGGTRSMGAIAFKTLSGNNLSRFFGMIWPAVASAAYIGTDGSNSIIVTNWKGNLGIFGYEQNNTLVVDAGFLIADNQWHWLEWDLDWGTAPKTQRLALDGNVIYNGVFDLNAGGLSVGSIGVYGVDYQYRFTSGTVSVDDVICYDDTDDGTPGCLTAASWPLGLKQFTTIRPSGDVTTDFTPLSGSDNYAMVDEADLDGDTTYNYLNGPVTGNRDLFSYTDLGFNPLSILTIGVVDAWQNAGAGALQMHALAKSSGVEMASSSKNLGSGYVSQLSMFYNDPSGNPWTGTTVNAANFGYETE